MQKVAFIDLEASGLGPASWPIEAGFCFAEGAPESWLIRPMPDWAQSAWDKKAETLHGIDIDALAKTGRPVDEVCERLNQALKEAVVYSDAPDWDEFWLYRLFSAAGMRQAFKLSDFNEVFAGASPHRIKSAIDQAVADAPHRHRASEDVLHMRMIYQHIRRTADEN